MQRDMQRPMVTQAPSERFGDQTSVLKDWLGTFFGVCCSSSGDSIGLSVFCASLLLVASRILKHQCSGMVSFVRYRRVELLLTGRSLFWHRIDLRTEALCPAIAGHSGMSGVEKRCH